MTSDTPVTARLRLDLITAVVRAVTASPTAERRLLRFGNDVEVLLDVLAADLRTIAEATT